MLESLVRTIRYGRSWSASTEAEVRPVTIDREGTALPACLLVPPGRREPLPGWIIMGGITRMGRFHPQLRRFAHALASSGAAVLVPEIPEWRRLCPTPRVTSPTLRASAALLASLPEVRPGKVGVVGLSFGAPQVANAAEAMSDRIAGAVLFGGYCDLERTLRYQLTGEHDWDGETYHVEPDPFGRWVMLSNYLTRVPGYEEAGPAAEAFHRLAAASSDLRCPAWLPAHDSLKEELGLCLPGRWREVFDSFAPRGGPGTLEPEEGAAWASTLTAAALADEPLFDPRDGLAKLSLPVRLIHGRGDRVVPFTESLRLREHLADEAEASVTITGLFAHSADHQPPTLGERIREGATLFGAMREIIATV